MGRLQNIKFYVEGYADELLLSLFVNDKSLITISKSCNDIGKLMERNSVDREHDYFIGILDSDKKKSQYKYFAAFEEIEHPDNFYVFQKKGTNQFLIYLCCPAIESWLLKSAEQANVKPDDFGIPSDIKGLCKITKKQYLARNSNFKLFLEAILNKNPESFMLFMEKIKIYINSAKTNSN